MNQPELSPERLTELLGGAGHGATVAAVDAAPIGTGQMAGNYRLDIDYGENPDGLPSAMVAKIPDGPAERRAVSASSYRLEVDFYANIAPLVRGRIPRCWASWRNEAGDDFVLLLEDLAPRVPGNQLAGCTVEQARLAAVNLAAIHASVWGGDALEGLLEPLGQDAVDGTNAIFPTLSTMFLDRFGGRLSDDARGIFERFTPLAGASIANQRDASGLIHGDYRLDNLLFAPDGSDVAAVDWQTIGRGLPGRDLGFFVATSFGPDERREVEDDLIDAYLAALADGGVTDYEPDTCRTDYAYGMVQIALTVVFGSVIAETTQRGDDMFTLMAERGAAAMDDLGTLDLLA